MSPLDPLEEVFSAAGAHRHGPVEFLAEAGAPLPPAEKLRQIASMAPDPGMADALRLVAEEVESAGRAERRSPVRGYLGEGVGEGTTGPRNYVVLPIVLMQSMPLSWQKQAVVLLGAYEMHWQPLRPEVAEYTHHAFPVDHEGRRAPFLLPPPGRDGEVRLTRRGDVFSP